MLGDTWLMPAKDTYHDAVRHALVKDGWTITHDPFTISWDDPVKEVIVLWMP